MQYLIMPFKSQMMLCGYKNNEYLKYWKYAHFGVDISTIQGNAGDDHAIYASGDGRVELVGRDNAVGNVVVVTYPDCYNHKTKKSCNLVARYMHLSSINVKAGQVVKQGDILGAEGNTGTGDYHLHIEFDTDTKYPAWSPQVKGSNIIKKGCDSTVNPSYIFHVGAGQKIVTPTYNPAWLNSEDRTIPNAPEENVTCKQCEESKRLVIEFLNDLKNRTDAMTAKLQN